MRRKREIKFAKGRKWSYYEAFFLRRALAKDIASGVEHFRTMTRYAMAPGELTEEEWDQVLKDIVWFFTEAAQGYPGIYRAGSYEGEEYKKQRAAYEARMERGKEAFVKYFDTLWD